MEEQLFEKKAKNIYFRTPIFKTMAAHETLLQGVDFSQMENNNWYIERCFEEIKKFQATGSYMTASQGKSKGYIGIHFDRVEGKTPSTAQINALYYFFDHQKEVLDALCNYLLKDYPRIIALYDYHEEDAVLAFPKMEHPEDIQNTIGIGSLIIYEDEKNNLSYYGFECGCPWDEEHGLGVIMHANRVIDIGDGADALSGTTEIYKDNSTYDAYLQRVKELELRREHYLKKQKKPWWKFWKYSSFLLFIGCFSLPF